MSDQVLCKLMQETFGPPSDARDDEDKLARGLERLREGERESIDLLTEALRSLGGARSQE